MNHEEPFVFCTERRLVLLTGVRARNLDELVDGLRKVPGSSVFYHTHHMYLAHHFETPMFSNDFSLWVSTALQEKALGEKLAAIDLLSFTTIRALREEIIAIIARDLGQNGRGTRDCLPGDEFHFCRSRSFILSMGLVAHNPREFFRLLPEVTNSSLFFHFFEARLRLGKKTSDISQWLQDRGERDLAKTIDAMDPYSVTLDEFKNEIVDLGRQKWGSL